jgi:hypothetical protein
MPSHDARVRELAQPALFARELRREKCAFNKRLVTEHTAELEHKRSAAKKT